MHPTLKTSPFDVYGTPLNVSGAKNPGVPDLFINSFSLISSANPKSTNLIYNGSFDSIIILSNFKSLCTNPFVCISKSASKILFNIVAIFFSDNVPLDLKYWYNVPP